MSLETILPYITLGSAFLMVLAICYSSAERHLAPVSVHQVSCSRPGAGSTRTCST